MSTLIHQTSPFNNLTAFKCALPGGMPAEKVAVNKKFTRIYCAGAKIVCLADSSNSSAAITPQAFESRMTHKEVWGQPVFGLKATPSGRLMVHENVSNDLLVIDKAGKEVARYNSMSRFVFSTLF